MRYGADKTLDTNNLILENKTTAKEAKISLNDSGELEKDIDGVVTPLSPDGVVKDALTNLEGLTRDAGKIFYATDEKLYYGDDGSDLVDLGGGGGLGSTSTAWVYDFNKTKIADIEVGTSSDLITTGAINSLVELETVAPLFGKQSLKVTIQAGSLNDWYAIPNQVIELGFRNTNKKSIKGFYSYINGNDYDVQIIAYDVTNSKVIDSLLVPAGSSMPYDLQIDSADNMASVRVLAKCINESVGAVLHLDNYSYETAKANIKEITTTQSFSWDSLSVAGSILNDSSEWRFNTTEVLKTTGADLFTIEDDVASGRTKWIAINDLDVNVVFSYIVSSNGAALVYKNGVSIMSGTYQDINTGEALVTANVNLKKGEFFSVGTTSGAANQKFRLNWRAAGKASYVATNLGDDADSMVRVSNAASHGSIDTKIVYFADVLDQVGNAITATTTVNTGTYFTINENGVYHLSANVSGAVGNWQAVFTLNSTQLTTNGFSLGDGAEVLNMINDGLGAEQASLSWSGVLKKGDIVRLHDEGSASPSPTRARMTVSKAATNNTILVPTDDNENRPTAKIQNNGSVASIKSWNVEFIESINRDSQGFVTIVFKSGYFEQEPAVSFGWKNDTAGNPRQIGYTALTKDSITIETALYTSAWQDFDFEIFLVKQGTDYKKKSNLFPATAAVQRTCYIKDVKSSGTHGGTFSSGAFRVRDLTEISGDTEIAELNSSKFKIQKGKYKIKWDAPAQQVGGHVSQLYNETDLVEVETGSGLEAASTAGATIVSSGYAIITISEEKEFSIRHWCESSKSTTGFGHAGVTGSAGVSSVYTQVEIIKVQ